MLKLTLTSAIITLFYSSIVYGDDSCPKPFFHGIRSEPINREQTKYTFTPKIGDWTIVSIAEVKIERIVPCAFTETDSEHQFQKCITVSLSKFFFRQGEDIVSQRIGTTLYAYAHIHDWELGNRFVAVFGSRLTQTRFDLLWAFPLGDSTDQCVRAAVERSLH